MTNPYAVAYQGNTGRLWIDGEGLYGFQYDSYYRGTFAQVKIQGGYIEEGGPVMWSAQTRTMIVGDQEAFKSPTFYWLDAHGNVKGETTLSCSNIGGDCGIVGATVKGPDLIAADNFGDTVKRFPFPAGGESGLSYAAPFGYEEPFGVAVSPDIP